MIPILLIVSIVILSVCICDSFRLSNRNIRNAYDHKLMAKKNNKNNNKVATKSTATGTSSNKNDAGIISNSSDDDATSSSTDENVNSSDNDSIISSSQIDTDIFGNGKDDDGSNVLKNHMFNSNNAEPIQFNFNDPMKQSVIPPEIVFFGEPRQPPPVEAASDAKYHGSLLLWSRHVAVAPKNSKERLERVFPRGKLHPQASMYRLNTVDGALTFDVILQEFMKVMDNLEKAKAFIETNIDLVPSKLFLRAITAKKLSAQSQRNVIEMERVKEIRRKYMLAHDQLFFPLNIEVVKAETRVMTYLSRDELRVFAKDWDEVEMSLHFSTLIAARLTWDDRVRDVLDKIDRRVQESVEYMANALRNDLMDREYRKPGLTAAVYKNASIVIQTDMLELYSKVKPEIKVVHEVYGMSEEETKSYVVNSFCPNNNIDMPTLIDRLKVYDATLSAIEDMDYIRLRLKVQSLYMILCTARELDDMNKWYLDIVDAGYGFETYEPDEIPPLVEAEQRLRETGNAFTDFAVQVLKMPTVFTESLSGNRPKGSTVGNWLLLDNEWNLPYADSFEKRMDAFKEAYAKQTELRNKEANAAATVTLSNRMETQDRILLGNWKEQIMDFNDDE